MFQEENSEQRNRKTRPGKKRAPILSSKHQTKIRAIDHHGLKEKKKRRNDIKWLREIKKYQRCTNLLINKLPFCRLVKEITQEVSGNEHRYTTQAIDALQEASEAYLVGLLEDSQLCSFHARRITLMKRDVELARRIRGMSMGSII